MDSLHESLFASLEGMGFAQLLLAFGALGSYALALGRLVSATARGRAACLALASAAGFCALSHDWTRATLVAALALVAIGGFAAAVWLLSAVMGLARPLAPMQDGAAGESSPGPAGDLANEPASAASTAHASAPRRLHST